MSDIQKFKKGGSVKSSGGGGGSSKTSTASKSQSGSTRPSGTTAKAQTYKPQTKKIMENAVKKANTGVMGFKKPGTSSNNLYAYSYTKPFYKKNNVGIDKKKPKGKRGTTEVVLAPDPGPDLDFDFSSDFSVTPSPVAVPERDVVDLATEELDAKVIENLLFENVGANELVKFVRHDTVEGNNASYNIISNLTDIRRKFDPTDLISVQIPDSNFVSNSINLSNKIPTKQDLDLLGISDYVYIDDSGNLIIEVVKMRDKEVVEIQIDTNGTIYEVN